MLSFAEVPMLEAILLSLEAEKREELLMIIEKCVIKAMRRPSDDELER